MPAFSTRADGAHREPTDIEVIEEATAIYRATPEGPSPEEIAAEAHRIYLGRGAEHGRDFDDWLEAERRLAPGHHRG